MDIFSAALRASCIGGVSKQRFTRRLSRAPDKVLYIGKKPVEFRLKGKEKMRFRALVQMDGDSGWVEFATDSKHGGMDERRISLRVE